jgi:hypothetical protein
VFYVPLALLHASLLMRLAGAAAGQFSGFATGGLVGAIALLAFVAITATAVLRGGAARP